MCPFVSTVKTGSWLISTTVATCHWSAAKVGGLIPIKHAWLCHYNLTRPSYCLEIGLFVCHWREQYSLVRSSTSNDTPFKSGMNQSSRLHESIINFVKLLNILLDVHACIHRSKSPKISFPILTWLHFPLLKCVLYHLLKENLWYLSKLDR